MRRNEREVTEPAAIRAVLDTCQVLRLAMVDGAKPYIVPLNFGYEMHGGQFTFYFHCAKEGRKLDILRQTPAVCLEFDCGHELVAGEIACRYSYRYQSVIAGGAARELTDSSEKAAALTCIMRHLTGREFAFLPPQTDAVCVWKITADQLTVKSHIN